MRRYFRVLFAIPATIKDIFEIVTLIHGLLDIIADVLHELREDARKELELAEREKREARRIEERVRRAIQGVSGDEEEEASGVAGGGSAQQSLWGLSGASGSNGRTPEEQLADFRRSTPPPKLPWQE